MQGRSGKTKSVKTNLQSVEKVSVLLNTVEFAVKTSYQCNVIKNNGPKQSS